MTPCTGLAADRPGVGDDRIAGDIRLGHRRGDLLAFNRVVVAIETGERDRRVLARFLRNRAGGNRLAFGIVERVDVGNLHREGVTLVVLGRQIADVGGVENVFSVDLPLVAHRRDGLTAIRDRDANRGTFDGIAVGEPRNHAGGLGDAGPAIAVAGRDPGDAGIVARQLDVRDLCGIDIADDREGAAVLVTRIGDRGQHGYPVLDRGNVDEIDRVVVEAGNRSAERLRMIELQGARRFRLKRDGGLRICGCRTGTEFKHRAALDLEVTRERGVDDQVAAVRLQRTAYC